MRNTSTSQRNPAKALKARRKSLCVTQGNRRAPETRHAMFLSELERENGKEQEGLGAGSKVGESSVVTEKIVIDYKNGPSIGDNSPA